SPVVPSQANPTKRDVSPKADREGLVREYGHFRQEDMALLTGLSQAFLSMLESGQRRLTNIDRIIVLLDGLNAPVDITGPMLRSVAAAPGPHLRTAS
ncbi:helix-turn-helix domain-containing protein, partial [Streptomyces sp. NPDC059168]|uniref:helix-turn-helix domain-containing protein n=1 Tax=Streptomyces sp. NPDC059168 TaxID=3346753 RepID=UPI00368FB7C0